MSVWSKLFPAKTAQTPSLARPSLGAPTEVAAIPGKLTVSFYAHDAVEGARGNFLSGVSRGFAKYKQGELVLTLRLDADDEMLAKMAEVARFFVTVHAWAGEGRLAVAGGLTQFGERAPLGRSRSGILYADARPMTGVEIPLGALAAILVDAQEVRTAQDYGAYRVLTRIGEDCRHFPFPLWSDLDRKSVVSERENESVLAKLARTNTPSVSFLAEQERLRILLSPSARVGLGRGLASLAPGAPFALLLKPAPQANALLVWHPGQKEPAAISADGSDGSRVSGSCLLVFPNAKEDQARMVEDGYSLHLSAESWAKLSSALRDERPASLRLADGLSLSLEWQSES